MLSMAPGIYEDDTIRDVCWGLMCRKDQFFRYCCDVAVEVVGLNLMGHPLLSHFTGNVQRQPGHIIVSGDLCHFSQGLWPDHFAMQVKFKDGNTEYSHYYQSDNNNKINLVKILWQGMKNKAAPADVAAQILHEITIEVTPDKIYHQGA